MCISCGCGLIHEDHGDHRHITIEDLQAAAEAANETIQTAAHNIESVVMHQFPVRKSDGFDEFVQSLDDGAQVVLKSEDERRFLLTVVYSPHRMPLRGADHRTDLASPEVLENACWKYAANGLGTGMWHEKGHADEAICVENTIYRGPDWALKDASGNEQVIKAGTWLAGYILSPHAWGLYKSGRIGGVSLDGRAGRKKASAEAIARVKGNAI